MADNDATRALFRELLGMTNGSTAGGRGSMQIPQDIMDSMAGDAAQDNMARNALIMEMRKQDSRQHDARFVSLDLMEMEATDVDSFLKSARKKIIKRAKPTRKACCAKIGGVLDQIMGAGGEDLANLELQGVRDRGKMDPIGDVDSMEEGREFPPGYFNAGNQSPKARKEREDRAKWDKHREALRNKGIEVHDYHAELSKRQADADAKAKHTFSPRPKPTTLADKEKRGATHNLPKIKHQHPEPEIKHAMPPKPKRNMKNATAFGAFKRRPGDAFGANQNQSTDFDLFNFIAEEFADWEHNNDCAFADPKFGRSNSPLGESYGSKRPGLVRDALGLDEAAGMAPGKLKALFRMLKQKKAAEGGLKGKDSMVYKRLQMIVGGQGGQSEGPKEEAYNMIPSHTANALSSFMEAKGSPDGLIRQDYAGDMSRKQRDDNSEYPTELTPVKSGGSKMAGELKPAKGARNGTPRYAKGADPIGESSGASRTAIALSCFMESSSQSETAKKKLAMRKGDAGELGFSDRDDTRENLGGPLEKADGARGKLDVYDDGGKKARFEKDANPIGGAVPAQQSGRRMKK
jgi:hypothetical protein